MWIQPQRESLPDQMSLNLPVLCLTCPKSPPVVLRSLQGLYQQEKHLKQTCCLLGFICNANRHLKCSFLQPHKKHGLLWALWESSDPSFRQDSMTATEIPWVARGEGSSQSCLSDPWLSINPGTQGIHQSVGHFQNYCTDGKRPWQ